MSSRRLLIAQTVALGAATLLAAVSCGSDPETGATVRSAAARSSFDQTTAPPVAPFTDAAATVLGDGYQIWNDLPGVVVFDYDRDGDMDLYITAEAGHANWLYRNDGSGSFTDVAEQAGVAAITTNTTGAVACDFDNDGFQDLYVGAWGNPRDGLGFRSPSEFQGNSDLLFINNGDGFFRDVTDAAFGSAVNIRSATTVACADVDGDGWLDIYVGNLADDDFINLQRPNHPGHYNMLYRNRGNLTFDEIAEEAGVKGPQVAMRDTEGQPILFRDPETGEQYEGYDPTTTDQLGNRVGRADRPDPLRNLLRLRRRRRPRPLGGERRGPSTRLQERLLSRRGEVRPGCARDGNRQGRRLDGLRRRRLRRRRGSRRLRHEHRLSPAADPASAESGRLVRVPRVLQLGHVPPLPAQERRDEGGSRPGDSGPVSERRLVD